MDYLFTCMDFIDFEITRLLLIYYAAKIRLKNTFLELLLKEITNIINKHSDI